MLMQNCNNKIRIYIRSTYKSLRRRAFTTKQMKRDLFSFLILFFENKIPN